MGVVVSRTGVGSMLRFQSQIEQRTKKKNISARKCTFCKETGHTIDKCDVRKGYGRPLAFGDFHRYIIENATKVVAAKSDNILTRKHLEPHTFYVAVHEVCSDEGAALTWDNIYLKVSCVTDSGKCLATGYYSGEAVYSHVSRNPSRDSFICNCEN